MSETRYVHALRFRALTRLYDPIVRWTTREATFKRALLDVAAIREGHRVLDLACGTGTLAAMVKAQVPGAEVIGVDGDPAILEIAAAKARNAAVEIQLVHGMSDRLPYADAAFDRVLSSLFFHHLDRDGKRATLREVLRVLRPGGQLHLADWGRPHGPGMRGAFFVVQLLDGFATTADNVAGRLPELMAEAGFASVHEGERIRTPLGTIALYRGERPC